MTSMMTSDRVDASEAPWAAHVRATHEALARHDLRAAVRAWDQAHLAAVGSLRWEGLVEVGDAYLRIGRASGLRDSSEATARKAYFAALFRACQQESLDGVLRVAGAFASLGDREVVDECIGLAGLVAADDGEARARVRACTGRLLLESTLRSREEPTPGMARTAGVPWRARAVAG